MRCEIRTTINIDDADLLELIEKCKEKHKLSELLEKALIAYCYQPPTELPSRVQRTSTVDTGAVNADTLLDVMSNLRSLSAQVSLLSESMQSNHMYTVEAFGRLSGNLEMLGRQPVQVVTAQPTGQGVTERVEPAATQTDEIGFANKVDEDEDIPVMVEAGEMVAVDEPSKVKPKKVEQVIEQQEPVTDKAEQKAEQKVEPVVEKPVESSTTDENGDGDDDEMSPEVMAMLAQFLGA